MKKVGEFVCTSLDDRAIMAGIMVKNGYTVGPGKIKSPSGKSSKYTLKIYRDEEESNA